MKDQFLPPPFGDARASWVIDGKHYRERVEAELAVREAGMNAKDAADYVQMLMTEYTMRKR